MTIGLPQELEADVEAQAKAHGVSAASYVRELLERNLTSSLQAKSPGAPFKTRRGMFAKYGQAPSAEEIVVNRVDMFSHFGEEF
jgi:hypothetical protein